MSYGVSLYLQAQAERCLNDDELRLLGSLLQEHATVMCLPAADGAEGEELRINYDGFNSVWCYVAKHSSILTPVYGPSSSSTHVVWQLLVEHMCFTVHLSGATSQVLCTGCFRPQIYARIAHSICLVSAVDISVPFVAA